MYGIYIRELDGSKRLETTADTLHEARETVRRYRALLGLSVLNVYIGGVKR